MDATENIIVMDVIERLDAICLLLEDTELWGEASQVAKAQKLLESMIKPIVPKKVLKSKS
jgi:hypothetical protein